MATRLRLEDLKQTKVMRTHTRLTRAQLQELVGGLDGKVRELHLHHAGIDDAGVAVLADKLRGLDELRFLALNNNDITDEGVRVLARVLLTGGLPNVQFVYLHRNRVSQDGVRLLRACVTMNDMLHVCVEDAYSELAPLEPYREALALVDGVRGGPSAPSRPRQTMAGQDGRVAELERQLLADRAAREKEVWEMRVVLAVVVVVVVAAWGMS